MYHDFNSTSRENWKYNYNGHELLKYAKIKHDEFLEAEILARKDIAKFMADINISADSKKVQEAKREVEYNGKQREACAVFVHEFARHPNREYNLSLGDVVFFGLIGDPIPTIYKDP